jgi:hypothetical protein
MFRLLRFRVLFAVVAILFAMGAAYSALHTTQGLRGTLKGDTPLDPGGYRAEIVDVEAILFSPGPISMEDRMQLAQAIDALRKDLDTRGGTDMAKFGARELGTLAGMSRGLGNLDGADLARVRANWMRIRSNTFQDDASWFRFSENDPVAPREAPHVALSAADRDLLERLRAVLDRIDEEIGRGIRNCDHIGEADPSWDGEQGERFARSWSEWGENWKSTLADVRSRMPPRPAPDVAPGVRNAYSAAESALQELQSIPNARYGRFGTPSRSDWERRFQGAAKKVKDARFWIDRAGEGLGG